MIKVGNGSAPAAPLNIILWSLVLAVLLPAICRAELRLLSAPWSRQVTDIGTELRLVAEIEATETPLTYAWTHNGRPISGTGGPTLSIPSFAATHAGVYGLTVTDGNGQSVRTVWFVLPGCARSQVVAWGTVQNGSVEPPWGLTDAVAVDGGKDFGLAVRADGRVVAWGSSYFGQSTVPENLQNVVAVSGGTAHSVALRSDGTLVAWGYNTYGQTQVPAGLNSVVAIAAGNYHTLALRVDGSVVAWGDNSANQTTVPTDAADVVAIAAGGNTSYALKRDGRVVAWGSNSSGEATVPPSLTDATDIVAGGAFALAVRADQSVVSWGSNSVGQRTLPDPGVPFARLAAGRIHGLGLIGNGSVVAWGSSANGQTAVPSEANRVFAISGSGDFSLALRDASDDVAPTVVQPPQDVVRALGDNHTFTVGVAGQGPFRYQWRKNGADIPNATNSSLLLADVTVDSAASYSVVVTNHAGATLSGAAILSIEARPAISTPVVRRETGRIGEPLTLTTTVTSANQPLTYRWRKDGRLIASGQSADLVVPTFTNADAGTYVVTATDSKGLEVHAAVFVTPSYRATQLVGAGSSTLNNFLTAAAGPQRVIAAAIARTHAIALRQDGTVLERPLATEWIYPAPADLSEVVNVTAHSFASIALKADGSLAAWGSSDDTSWALPATLRDVVQVAAGANHFLALRANGRVVAWGHDNSGETQVPAGLDHVVRIAAGDSFSLALREDGSIVAWGANNRNQLAAPASGAPFRAIGAGALHGLAVRENGEVVAWGYKGYGQTTVPTGLTAATAVVGGNLFSAALKADGTVSAWGIAPLVSAAPAWRDVFSLAAAPITNDGLALRDADNDAMPVITANPQSGLAVVKTSTTLSVTATGPGLLIYQWRKNGVAIPGATTAALAFASLQSIDEADYDVVVSNHVGSATSAVASLTVDVPPTPQTEPVRRSALLSGASITLESQFVSRNQPLQYQWSRNNLPLADATAPALTISDFSPAKAGAYTLTVTDSHGLVTRVTTFLLPRFGATQTRSWGRDLHRNLSVPEDWTDLVAVSAGDAHLVGLRTGGAVRAWGDNDFAQCNVPANLSDAVAVAAGDYHSVALIANGNVVAWGNTNRNASIVPAGLAGIIAIAAGGEHTLALDDTGKVTAWGKSDFGMSTVPADLGPVTAVAAGTSHSLALQVDGTVRAWGDNQVGQCNVPAGLANVVAIAAGSTHSVAIRADGSVVAWGNNYDGQVTIPAGLAGVRSAAGGGEHTLAMLADGTLRAWGRNDFGQATLPEFLGPDVFAVAACNHLSVLVRDATLTPPPEITAQPQGGLRLSGESIALSVTFTGVGPIRVQWRKNGMPIAGATSATLVLPSLQANDAGTYDVVLHNYAGDTTSSPAAVRVVTRPAFRVTGTLGQPVTLTVSVSGTNESFSYLWKKDGRMLAGATNASISIPSFSNADSGAYSVAITDSHGAARWHTTFVRPYYASTRVVGWGYNVWNQAGSPAVEDIEAIFARGDTSAAIRRGGEVLLWGYGETTGMTVVSPSAKTRVVSVALGSDHVLALRDDGTVVAWGGFNSYGERNVPANLTDVIAIAAGTYHSLALKADGTVVVWGANFSGESTLPANLPPIAQLVNGPANASVALLPEGKIVAWGYNGRAAAGVPTTLNNVVHVSGAVGSVTATRADGTVVAWGVSSGNLVSLPTNLNDVASTATGSSHYLALHRSGTITAWGDNQFGAITVPSGLDHIVGVAAGSSYSLALRDTSEDPVPMIEQQPRNAIRATGSRHTFSVRAISPAGGGILSYQWRKDGQPLAQETSDKLYLTSLTLAAAGTYDVLVSNSTGTVASAPATLTIEPPTQVTSRPAARIVGALREPLVLTVSATSPNLPLSYQWRKDNRDIADATTSVLSIPAFAQTDAGAYTLVIRDSHGLETFVTTFVLPDYSATTVVGWGDNGSNQATVPAGLNDIVAISCGYNFSGALRRDGAVTFWGVNSSGQGTPPTIFSDVVSLLTGYSHSVVLRSNGSVTAWGNNYSGSTNVPSDLEGVVALAGCGSFTLALKHDRTVAAWGNNSSQQTVLPANLADVVAISAGYDHGLALKADGTVVAWGYNGAGQAVVPAGLTGVKAIASGASFNLALKTDGTVVAWGSNGAGQSAVPAGLADVVAIAAGGAHAAALKADGTAVFWGDNSCGQAAVPSNMDRVVDLAAGGYFSLALRNVSTYSPQTITFDTLPHRPFTTQSIVLAATATSNLPITFKVLSGPATITDNLLTLSGPGTIVVEASQSGNRSYLPAVPVTRTFFAGEGAVFETWRLAHFPTDALADFTRTSANASYSGDGISNLVKYALGLPPLQPAPGLPVETTYSENAWHFLFERPSNRTDLIYEVECSTDLTTWSSEGIQFRHISSHDEMDTWEAVTSASGKPRIFYRLKVTLP